LQSAINPPIDNPNSAIPNREIVSPPICNNEKGRSAQESEPALRLVARRQRRLDGTSQARRSRV
jgi:hypothetical protein